MREADALAGGLPEMFGRQFGMRAKTDEQNTFGFDVRRLVKRQLFLFIALEGSDAQGLAHQGADDRRMVNILILADRNDKGFGDDAVWFGGCQFEHAGGLLSRLSSSNAVCRWRMGRVVRSRLNRGGSMPDPNHS